MINSVLEKYIKNYLNLQKSCEDECEGNNEDNCEKCMIISAHRFLYGSLKQRLALSSEVDSSSDDIQPFLTGSYRRHTIISPPKDVDGFVPLNADDYQDFTPKEIIELVYSELIEVYKDQDHQPEITIQSHSVSVKFSDTFGADVIPAFPDGELYKIPELDGSEDGKWLISNPKKHIEFVSRVNKKNNGLVIPVVKLLKSWRRDKFETNGIDMKAFHLEMLAVYIFDEYEVSDFSQGLVTFFTYAKNFLHNVLPDPALAEVGENSDLNELLSHKDKTQVIQLILQDSDRAKRASELEASGKTQDAIELWKEIFTSDDFAKTANLVAGEQLAEKLRTAPLYTSSSNPSLSFERQSDDSRRIPATRSWWGK